MHHPEDNWLNQDLSGIFDAFAVAESKQDCHISDILKFNLRDILIHV